MNRQYKAQQGFGTIEVLLIVIIVALAGVAGWFVYEKHNKPTSPTPVKTTATISFTHNLFYKNGDSVKTNITYQKSQWHIVSTSSDRGSGDPCAFLQSNTSDLIISVGQDCEIPQEHDLYPNTNDIRLTCPDTSNEVNDPPCTTESKTLQTINLSTPGHKYTSFEPFDGVQPVDLQVHRQTTDSGKTWRYWLTLEEITVDYPKGASGGATTLDSYLSEPEVIKAMDVLQTIKSQ